MTRVIIAAVFLLGISAGIIALQIYLSKKDNKWAGLVLPFISVGISIMAMLGVLLFSAYEGRATLIVNGEVVEQTSERITDLSSIIGTSVLVLVMFSIPTAVLFALYFACRGKRSKRQALDKMSAQDLE